MNAGQCYQGGPKHMISDGSGGKVSRLQVRGSTVQSYTFRGNEPNMFFYCSLLMVSARTMRNMVTACLALCMANRIARATATSGDCKPGFYSCETGQMEVF